MCFSASASFLVGASLLVVGATTLNKVSRRVELPFASIPLLFGVQQLMEGGIWLGLQFDAPPATQLLTLLYSLFSHLLWPIYVPLAMLLLEPEPARRKINLAFVWAGVAAALYLLYVLIRFPLQAKLVGGHILYGSFHDYALLPMGAYLVATCVSLLFSTHRMVEVLGFVLLLSCIAAYLFYRLWFISVWCFFAAILSAMVYLYFHRRGARAAQELGQGA
ncbi:MAG: hypothetical protein IT471_01310 [Pseudomonadales bacterium]|nr:hypothetical protein [Pseudomonadales bacterium]MCC6528886.1 hypothetical protein [Pseudomonadales bacterium]MCP5333659.1 hypothetical protein [Pseudomonadales bacterium]